MSPARIVSALVLIAVVGGTVWWLPAWATVALAAVVAAAAGVELAQLARPLGVAASETFVAFSAAAFCILLSANTPSDPVQPETIVALTIGLAIAAALVTVATTSPGAPVFVSIAIMLLAPLYVGLPLGTMAWVRSAEGPAALTWLVAVIAISDSAQYYAGTLLGKRKLAPVISPKKTVEGAIGGLVAAPVVGMAIAPLAMPHLNILVVGVLALGLAMFGMAGDLFESLLKRSAGAKDSSSLIPGHGGILDRIDAYLLASPVFYLFLRYIA